MCKELGLDRKNVELSMGMSADYENAVSSSIRATFYHTADKLKGMLNSDVLYLM